MRGHQGIRFQYRRLLFERWADHFRQYRRNHGRESLASFLPCQLISTAPVIARLLLAVILAAALPSCAGPQLKKASTVFRSQVSEVDVGVQGSYEDAHSGVTASGEGDVRFKLRDPSKDGLSK